MTFRNCSLALTTVALLALSACATSDDSSSPGQTEPSPAVSTRSAAPSSTPSPGDSGSPDATASDRPQAAPADSTPFCTLEPEASAIQHVEFAHPEGWQIEEGNCEFFDAELSELPEDTEPPAAIGVRVADTAFHRAAAPGPATREDARYVGARSGYQAVRILGESTGEGLRPKGQPVLTYLVDLDPGTDDNGGTLVMSAHPTDGTSFSQAERALDRMADSVRVVPAAVEPGDPIVVTRTEGGGNPYTVTLEDDCFQLRPGGPTDAVTDEACDLGFDEAIEGTILGDSVVVGYAPALATAVVSDAASAPYGAFTANLEGGSAFAFATTDTPVEVRALDVEGDVIARATIG